MVSLKPLMLNTFTGVIIIGACLIIILSRVNPFIFFIVEYIRNYPVLYTWY